MALGMPDGPDWPRAVVEHLLAALPPDAPAGSDQASAADDLEAMVALSLVTLVAPSAGSAASTSSTAALGVRVRLHPLVRELAGAQWTSHPEAMQRAGLEALLAAVAELVEEQADDFAALNQEEALIAGVLRRAAQAHLAPTQVVAAISSLARYLTVGGHWRLGMELFTLQLAIQREVGDRAGEGEKLNNLGYLASDLGHKEEAARYYEQALAIFDAIGAVDSARVVRDNLAAIAQDHVAAGDSSSDQEISDHPITLAEVVDEGDDAGQVAAPSPEPPSVLVEVHRPFPTMCRRVRRQNTCESGRLICSSLCARMRTRWGQG